jgi:hypothetical protein
MKKFIVFKIQLQQRYTDIYPHVYVQKRGWFGRMYWEEIGWQVSESSCMRLIDNYCNCLKEKIIIREVCI